MLVTQRALNALMRNPARSPGGRRAELVLSGVRDVPAHLMLSVAEGVRRALAQLDVSDVSIRVTTEDDEEQELLPGVEGDAAPHRT